jgi:FtsZ-interacting cell division protein ZipA
MSDLQIGLAVLGALVVASVFAFNWWQERQFRRRAENAFTSRHGDVLMEEAAAAPEATRSRAEPAPEPGLEQRIEPRIEPQLEAVSAQPSARHAEPPSRLGESPAAEANMPEPAVDYIVEIRAGEFIAPEQVARLQETLARLGRKIAFGGFDYEAKAWGPITTRPGRLTAVRAAIQLVDRSGPVTEEQLRFFGEAVRETAHAMAAIAELPEFASAMEQARELDEFCAEVDVVVGINVIARTGQVFHGTKVRALAEAAGFHLRPDGIFHIADERGATLFCLDNQEAEPFVADKIRTLATSGITFLLDVPRVANGIKAFDRMVAASRGMAEALDGMLADDNRVTLNDGGLDKIRNQLRSIYAAMEHRGIQPGSPLALRLFS